MTQSSESEATGVFLFFWAPSRILGSAAAKRAQRRRGGLVAGGPLQHLRRALESASEMAFSFLLFEIIKIPKAQIIPGNHD